MESKSENHKVKLYLSSYCLPLPPPPPPVAPIFYDSIAASTARADKYNYHKRNFANTTIHSVHLPVSTAGRYKKV